MAYCVLEPRPDSWHYVGISLAANSIFQGLKVWKHYRCLKPSTVLKLLSVNAVAVTLANHGKGYLYGFKAWYSYLLQNLRNEVYLSCLDFRNVSSKCRHILWLSVKCKDWKSIHIGSGDATLFTLAKSNAVQTKGQFFHCLRLLFRLHRYWL